MVARDQRAEFAASHLQVVLRRVEVGLHAGDVCAELVDVIDAGLGRQFRVGLVLQISELRRVVFLDLLRLRPRLLQLTLGELHLVGHHAQLAFELRVGVFGLCETLAENLFIVRELIFLGRDGLRQLFGLGRRRPAHTQPGERNHSQSHDSDAHPARSALVLSDHDVLVIDTHFSVLRKSLACWGKCRGRAKFLIWAGCF